jgi:hypothetical protein
MAQGIAMEPWELIAQQLNENVVKRAIRVDLRLGERGRRRDAGLLEGVFRLACRYAGQAPSLKLFEDELARGAHQGTSRHQILN